MWIVWLLLAVFAGEWLLLWLVIHTVSREHLILAVLTVVIVTIIVGCVAVYFRVQRRIR
jgi:hypothetical protein